MTEPEPDQTSPHLLASTPVTLYFVRSHLQLLRTWTGPKDATGTRAYGLTVEMYPYLPGLTGTIVLWFSSRVHSSKLAMPPTHLGDAVPSGPSGMAICCSAGRCEELQDVRSSTASMSQADILRSLSSRYVYVGSFPKGQVHSSGEECE